MRDFCTVNKNKSIISAAMLCSILFYANQKSYAQEVLTKVNGGASWEAASNIYGSNGTISSDRVVNANSKDLTFENVDQLVIENASSDNVLNIDAPNNEVGIRTGSPNSSLHVNGSVSYATANFSASSSNSYTMGDDDYLLFASTTSSSATINLPNANTCPGRVYRFIKTRTNNSLIFSPTIMVNSTTSQGIFSGTDVKLTIISNGTNWWKLEN